MISFMCLDDANVQAEPDNFVPEPNETLSPVRVAFTSKYFRII